MGCHLQFFHQSADDVLLEGASQNHIKNTDAAVFRGEPLNATDPLLYDHRVPGKVVIRKHIRNLQIDALGPRLSGYDHMDLRRILPEPRDGVLIAPPRGTIDDADLNALRFKKLLNGRLSLQATGKNHHAPAVRLFLPKLFDQGSQPLQFRARAHWSDDRADCGGKFHWNSSVPRHG